MDLLRQCTSSLKDPKIVANIQNFFGVAYDDVVASKSLHVEEPHSTFRRKSVQQNPDGHETAELESQSDKNTSCEDGDYKIKDNFKSAETKTYKNYKIRNKLWYCLFFFGTYLGDEVGYAIVLPFLIWNIDGNVGRKLVLVWTIVMYVGQSIKDIVKWPRPSCPPVIRLQKKWALEYGMPSTHAMVGVAFPSCILYYSIQRYDFPIIYGIIISVIWCSLISFSRLYLGMHSLLDVLVGLLLSSALVTPLLPLVNYVDKTYLNTDWYPLGLFLVSMFLLYIYPKRGSYTPTLGDTAIILGTCVGIQSGNWFGFRYHILESSRSNPPYQVEIPELKIIGKSALRTIIGLFAIVISFVLFDVIFKISDKFFEKINITVRDRDSEKRRKPFFDITYKYLSFCVTSFHVACSLPYLFKILEIGRYSFYQE